MLEWGCTRLSARAANRGKPHLKGGGGGVKGHSIGFSIVGDSCTASTDIKSSDSCRGELAAVLGVLSCLREGVATGWRSGSGGPIAPKDIGLHIGLDSGLACA